MQQGNKIILFIGILTIALGIFFRYQSAAFIRNAIKTEGRAVNVRASNYYVRYQTADGTEKSVYRSQKQHGRHEGDLLTLWYKPDNPDKIRLSDGKKTSRNIILGGIACIILGVYPLFTRKR
jgi:hypothetical protein